MNVNQRDKGNTGFSTRESRIILVRLRFFIFLFVRDILHT